MNKFALLMFSLAGPLGCTVDAPTADDGEPSSATAEADLSTDGAAPQTFGQGHVIRLANTNLCLRPLGGSTGFVPTELVACDFSAPSQNWIERVVFTGDVKNLVVQFVNVQSQLCLWAFGDVATTGTGIGVIGCNVQGTNTAASNSLWRPSPLTGFATLQSRLGHKNTGFCLDRQSGGQQLSACDSRASEIWGIDQE